MRVLAELVSAAAAADRLLAAVSAARAEAVTGAFTASRKTLAALMVDGVTPAGLGRGIRATVNVTVPVLTLLGRSDEPGHLEGCGPIDPETARELAAGAPSFTRILVHPETGVMLSVGRNQYRVPKDLRYDNLASLCAPDHRLKTQTNWTVTQLPGGVLAWTAPSGLHYRSDPATPFEPPGVVEDPPPFDPPPF